MKPERLDELQERLNDCRSRRVIFVSHCLLNQNVRYLGGACRPGAIDELVDGWQRDGVGIATSRSTHPGGGWYMDALARRLGATVQISEAGSAPSG